MNIVGGMYLATRSVRTRRIAEFEIESEWQRVSSGISIYLFMYFALLAEYICQAVPSTAVAQYAHSRKRDAPGRYANARPETQTGTGSLSDPPPPRSHMPVGESPTSCRMYFTTARYASGKQGST